MSNTIALYPLSNFTFSTKEAQPEEDPSVSARLQRLQNNYEDFGMRRTVEGILVVHDHGHPHILMLQIANAFFKLPGDYLKPGEDEIEGLKRRLDERLAPPTDSRQFNASHGVDNDWEIGDCLAQWWRPNFETFMVRRFPHNSNARMTWNDARTSVSFRSGTHHETEGMQKALPCPDARTQYVDLYLRHPSSRLLSSRLYAALIKCTLAEVLAVPKNMKLLAIPLFELYDNAAR
ncbi:hypothetical protein EW146_g2463 [Bondarzewia mesenterica]|uniref:Cleavage and polyadenylation specificity factor subunit 5 n=1 Tax=Bondarzewia mesenterica TaxID=1095465 RepID=A0A4S4M236_9AGAM|nr:hypothetical protein EW146_g2463 [Bondarzewia mesenterica]